MSTSPLRTFSALAPLAMSCAALVMVLASVALSGAQRAPDEGTAAHVFQLLIAGQVPIVAYFAWRWLPPSPRQGLGVLALQAFAIVAAFLPVYYFNL